MIQEWVASHPAGKKASVTAELIRRFAMEDIGERSDSYMAAMSLNLQEKSPQQTQANSVPVGSPTERDGLLRNRRHGVRPKQRRLLDRDAIFHQSKGTFAIRRDKAHTRVLVLFWRDLFHSLLNMSTWKLCLVLVALYLGITAVFAALFWTINLPCSLELDDYRDAFMLSLETVSTIGYGLEFPFYRDCPSGPAVLSLVVITSMFLDALFIGLLFARFGRAQVSKLQAYFSL